MKIYAIRVKSGRDGNITGYYMTRELAQKDLREFATCIKKSVPNLEYLILEDLESFTYTNEMKITYEVIEIDVIDS